MGFDFWGAVGLGVSGLFSGPAFHFPDSFFHLLTWFECDHKLLRDKDFVPRPRVAGLASSPPLDLKNPEISELDAVVFDQCLDDGIEGFLDDFLGLELGEPNLFRDGFNDLFLGHDGVPYETGQIDEDTGFQALPLMSQV